MATVSSKTLLAEISQQVLFQKIGDICATVTGVISPKNLLEISLRKIMELFGAKRGSIFILNANGKNLTLKIAEGMKLSEQKKIVKRLGEGIVGRVAELKKPIVVDDISQDSRFENYRSRSGYSTSSFICAPLLIKDKLIGVINIADKVSGGRFDKDELQLLDFLSTQIALNYRRVQLYQKFKKVVKESKTLKNQLGKSSKEASALRSEIIKKEKLATIGKLAGGIAHEFNNPLDGVLRYTNLCLEQSQDNEVLHGYLVEIKQGLNRMASIVKSLLSCSRSPGATLRKINPNLAIRQAIQGLEADLYHKNIDLEVSLQEGLPSLMDFGLEQIASNLLRNAIDAVENKGKIYLNSQLIDGIFVLRVSDNGCGMTQDMLQKIFEPFFTTKDIEKGCGLGLTVVDEIVKSYHGEIKIDSSLKKGTTFSVFIPLN